MSESLADAADAPLSRTEPPSRIPVFVPLRGLVAREPAQDRRSPGFDYPRLTGRL